MTAMYLDRNLSPAVEAALGDPRYRFLVEAVRTQTPPGMLDLRFRSNRKTGESEATLYLGADAAARLLSHPKRGISLEGCSANALAGISPEGRVHARLCSRLDRAVLDREVAFRFTSKLEKKTVLDGVREPLVTAVASSATVPNGKPPALGQEIDALAIDDDGRLLVIEVKAGTDEHGVQWAPAQVTFYAHVVRRWLSVDANARANLEEMRDARARLQLGPAPALRDSIDVVPVIAIGTPGPSDDAIDGLKSLQIALLAAGVGWSNLEVWSVRRDGTTTRL